MIPRTPEITLVSFSPVCLASLREQQMRDANNYSCRELTGVRLFPSKKITFLSLGFMILHSWTKQYSAIKEGKTQRVWNVIFIPRSEGWSWPKEKRLNLSWRWEESVQVTQASASPALWQCVHVLWREKLQTCWEPTLGTVGSQSPPGHLWACTSVQLNQAMSSVWETALYPFLSLIFLYISCLKWFLRRFELFSFSQRIQLCTAWRKTSIQQHQ